MTNSQRQAISKQKYNSGQSLTELLVLMILLVPLFMLIPVLGQYTHIKQRTVEASRGAAWEMTVVKDHIYDPAQQQALQNKVASRYFNGAKARIKSTAPGQWKQPDPLFKTLYGQTLVTYNDVKLTSVTEQAPTNSVLSKTLNAVGKVLSYVPGAGDSFPPNRQGQFAATVEVAPAALQINDVTSFGSSALMEPFAGLNLTFQSKTVLLTDPWHAKGSGMNAKGKNPANPRSVKAVTGALVPTSYFGSSLNSVLKFASWIPIFSDLCLLKIGRIAPDVVPKDRLKAYKGSSYRAKTRYDICK